MKGLNSCCVADAAGQQPPLLRVMASVMGYCVILARFYGNAELASNEPVVLNVCLPSFYTETAGLLIFLRLFQNHPTKRRESRWALKGRRMDRKYFYVGSSARCIEV